MPNEHDDTRRRALGGLLIAGSALMTRVAVAAPALTTPAGIAKEADNAAVYHADFGDVRRYSQMLDNVRNHLAAYEFDPLAMQIVIVAHAAGIKFFLDDLKNSPWADETLDPDLVKRAAALAGYGVRVLLCRFTFEKNNLPLDRAIAVSWVRMVPSGIATVAALQGKGFAYVKVG